MNDARKDKRTAGFTLVDVSVAVAILTIATLAAVQSQLSSFSVTRSSRELSIATADLEAAMESVLALPTDAIPVAGSEFEAGTPVARFASLHLLGQSLVATYPGYTLGGPIPNPLVIVLTLTWSDQVGNTREIQARTVKLR